MSMSTLPSLHVTLPLVKKLSVTMGTELEMLNKKLRIR